MLHNCYVLSILGCLYTVESEDAFLVGCGTVGVPAVMCCFNSIIPSCWSNRISDPTLANSIVSISEKIKNNICLLELKNLVGDTQVQDMDG